MTTFKNNIILRANLEHSESSEGSPGRLAPPVALVASRIFGLRAAVKLWYNYNRSTGQEGIFNSYKEEKRWKN